MRTFMIGCTLALLSVSAFARGGGSGHSGSHSSYGSYSSYGTRSSIPSSGTGSKSKHSHVNGYTKHDGTYVAPHERSTPDHTKNNNWDTKGNYNLDTGKDGTRRGDD